MSFFKNLFSEKKEIPPPSTSPSTSPAQSVTPKWHSQLVLVCEKCGKKLDPDARVSLELKDSIKKKLVAEGKWGPVRVLTSSCLDLCPKDRITVAFTGDSGQPSEMHALELNGAKEWVLKRIDERIKRP